MKLKDLNLQLCPRNKNARLPKDTENKIRYMIGFQFKPVEAHIRSFGGLLSGNIYMTRGDDNVTVDFQTGKAIEAGSCKEVFNIVEG